MLHLLLPWTEFGLQVSIREQVRVSFNLSHTRLTFAMDGVGFAGENLRVDASNELSRFDFFHLVEESATTASVPNTRTKMQLAFA